MDGLSNESEFHDTPEERGHSRASDDSVFKPLAPIAREHLPVLVPRGVPNPSRRRRAQEGRIRVAKRQAAQESRAPIVHVRGCVVALSVLLVLRLLETCRAGLPGYPMRGMHLLSTASDIACICCSMPLLAGGTEGYCVEGGFLGPALTLVFAMSCTDGILLCAFIVLGFPRKLLENGTLRFQVLEASFGVWDILLFASAPLQLALVASLWRVYRELRKAGVYPPGSDPLVEVQKRDISMLEVMCEVEDAEAIENCTPRCDRCDADRIPLLSGDKRTEACEHESDNGSHAEAVITMVERGGRITFEDSKGSRADTREHRRFFVV